MATPPRIEPAYVPPVTSIPIPHSPFSWPLEAQVAPQPKMQFYRDTSHRTSPPAEHIDIAADVEAPVPPPRILMSTASHAMHNTDDVISVEDDDDGDVAATGAPSVGSAARVIGDATSVTQVETIVVEDVDTQPNSAITPTGPAQTHKKQVNPTVEAFPITISFVDDQNIRTHVSTNMTIVEVANKAISLYIESSVQKSRHTTPISATG